MTDTYHAGQIKVSARLDASKLDRDLSALDKKLSKKGEDLSRSFSKSLTSGFKGGQFGKQINKALEDGLGNGFDAVFGGLDAKVETSISNTEKKTKNRLGAFGRSLAKGGVVGIILEGVNHLIGSGIEKLAESARQATEANKRYAESIVDIKKALADAEKRKSGDLVKTFEEVELEELTAQYGKAKAEFIQAADQELSAKADEAFENLQHIRRKLGSVQSAINRQKRKIVDAEREKFTDPFGSDYDIRSAKSAIASLRNDQRSYERQRDQRSQEYHDSLFVGREYSQTAQDRGFTPQQIEASEKALMLEYKKRDTLEEQSQLQQRLNEIEKIRVREQERIFNSNLNGSGKAQDALDSYISRLKATALSEAKIMRDRTIWASDLELAQLTNQTAEIERLEDQLLLQGKLEEFQAAGVRNAKSKASEFVKDRRTAIRKKEEDTRLEALQIQANEVIAQAKRLANEVAEPIDIYKGRLRQLSDFEKNVFLVNQAGGSETFAKLRIKALSELASSTGNYQLALSELINLQKGGLISAEQFGQAFQDLTDPIEGAGDSLERLKTFSDNKLITPAFFEAAKAAIEASKDFTSDMKNEQIERNQNHIKALEEEALDLRRALELAELRQAEGEVEKLENRLDVVKETIEQLNTGEEFAVALENAQEKKREEKAKQKEDEIAKLEGDVKELFKGGLKAAIDGDFEDFLANKLQSAADNMFDNAIDTLLDALLKEGGPLDGLITSLFGGEGSDPFANLFGNLFGDGKSSATGEATDALGNFTEGLTAAEGGLGEFGGALGALFGAGAGITELLGGNGKIGGLLGVLPGLFAGFFADGGVVPRGKFAIVGEEGPEVISSGASPLRVTPLNDNYAATATAGMVPDGGGVRQMSYAPINNFYGHTQDDLKRSLDERDRALKAEMPGMMDRHRFNQNRGMA